MSFGEWIILGAINAGLIATSAALTWSTTRNYTWPIGELLPRRFRR